MNTACLCGCGGEPVNRRRSQFLPGHDSRLLSRLYRAARSGERVAVGGVDVDPLAYGATVSEAFSTWLQHLVDNYRERRAS